MALLRKFPMASKTFSVYRRLQNLQVGNNIVPQSATLLPPIITGLSILLRDEQDVVLADARGAGEIFTGGYLAFSFVNCGVILGDIIEDETEQDRYGKQIRYSVTGLTITPICCEFHLKRLDVGI